MILSVLIALSPIYGIYLNRHQASREAFMKKIYLKADDGLINAIVIDIKDDHGVIPYRSKVELANIANAVSPSLNIDSLKAKAVRHNLKLIARIAVFRDDRLSRIEDYAIKDRDSLPNRWVDSKGIGWVDPYNRRVWEYNTTLANEILSRGFDLVLFDYVRFPSDGELQRCIYSDDKDRYHTIEAFVRYVKKEIGDFGICVFGYSVWRPLKREGQRLKTFKEIKAICPMLYPSHFSPKFCAEKGSERPYYIYFNSTRRLKDSLPDVAVYPFVQGFDYLTKKFEPEYIESQIEGLIDGGGDGFFIWHAAGDYDVAWKALERIGGRMIAFRIGRGSHRARRGHRDRGKDYQQARIRTPFRKRTRIRPLHDSQSGILP